MSATITDDFFRGFADEVVLLMCSEMAKNDSFTITQSTLRSEIFTSPHCKFTFSSTSMVGFNSDRINRIYTEALGKHILDIAPVITIIVHDFNYTNATKLIQALKACNKLSEFRIGAPAARSFKFIHFITSAVSKDPSPLLRFLQATTLEEDDADIDTKHTFKQCEDLRAVWNVLRELDAVRPDSVHVAQMVSAFEEVQDEEKDRAEDRTNPKYREEQDYLQDFQDATDAAELLREMEG